MELAHNKLDVSRIEADYEWHSKHANRSDIKRIIMQRNR